MKKQITSICVMAMCMVWACGSGLAEPAEGEAAPAAKATAAKKKAPGMRTWTSTSGAKLKGVYVETNLGRVSLRGADGKVVAIPLNRLSAKDREWIEKMEARGKGTGGIREPAKPNHLPVFADGEWRMQHAVYTAPNFDALMDRTGTIKVYPKVNGERVGKPMRYQLTCWYMSTKSKPPTHMRREVERYTQAPKPRMQPDSITLMGELTNEVPFTVTFEFSKKGITAWGYCKDPAGIDETRYRVGAWMPKSHNFDDETPLDERARILKDWKLIIEPIEGKTIRYDYAESIPRMNVFSERVRIEAPLYGKRKVSFRAGDADEGPLRPYIYSGRCPWQGYFVGMYKEEQSDRSKKLKFVMEIK